LTDRSDISWHFDCTASQPASHFLTNLYKSFLIIYLLFHFSSVFAAGTGITYHGRIMNPDGTPVTSSNVYFKIEIRTPGAENCLMYSETHIENLSLTSGVFSVTINDGTAVVPNGEPFTLSEIFRNHGTFNFAPGKCSGGLTYAPNPTDGRKMVVSFDAGSGWENLPAQSINFVPMAIEAQTVAGRTPMSFLRVDDTAASTNTTELNGADLTAFWDLINGTSTQYMRSSSSNGASLPVLSTAPGSASAGTIWYDSTGKTIQYFDGTTTHTVGTSGGSVTGITVGSGLVDGLGNTGTTISSSGTIALPDVVTADTYTKVTTDAKGRVISGTDLVEADIPKLTSAGKGVDGSAISGTIGGATVINTSGNITTSGDLSVNDITATGNITNDGNGSTTGVIYGAALQSRKLYLYDGDTNRVSLQTPSNLSGNYDLTLPVDDGTSGQVLSTDGSGVLSWISPATGSVTSVSGTSPIQVTGTTTPVISVSDATTLAKGVVLLAKDDGTDTTALHVVQANDPRLSDSRDASGTASGDLSGTYPSPKVIKIQGVDVDGTAPTATSQVLKYDTTGSKYVASYFGIADLKSSLGSQQFPTSCSASQTMKWSAITDTFSCDSIGIAANQITSGTIDTARLGSGTADGTTFLRGDGTWSSASGAASDITNTPSGNLSANNVQSAINELDIEKVAKSGDSMTGALTMNAQSEIHFADSDSSNYVGFKAPASISADKVWTLPDGDGSSGQVLSTDGFGVLSWTSPAMTSGVSVTAPITNSGTSAAPNLGISQATTSTNGYLSSTDWNTFNDKQSTSLANGKIWVGSAGGTAAAVTPSGDATISNAGVITVSSSANFSGSLSGDVTGTQGSTVVASVGGSTASNVHAAELLANAATSANTASTIVKRDPSGNFSAGTITANLSGNVTGNVTGDVTGDVSGTAANVTGTVAVANGGTGLGTTPTNGQILIGNGTGYTLATITAGTGVTITNNAGSITISAASGSNGLRSCDTGNANDVMVPVGSWCVDKYEASIWSNADGSGTGYFTDSTTSGDTDPYYPTGAANVPSGCNRNGAGCSQYAVSKPGVIPSRGITWYQAAKFCANAGKQLIPDSLWQTAAIGTYDPGSGSGTGGTAGGSASDAAAAQCNINTHNATWTTWLKANNGVRRTDRAGTTAGGTNACVSDYGVDDMVGNLWEWTDMNGVQAGADQTTFTQGKSNASGGPFSTADGTWNINGSAWGCDGAGTSKGTCGWKNNTPAAAFRGGAWSDGATAGVTALVLNYSGSYSGWNIGFRCARPR
jgi:formylglycine-generating enzyme required for sulfatase activity